MKRMLSAAIAFAVEMHDGQFDKSGLPYILHTLKVMHYLKTDDEELMCIAICHDVVEDCFADDHEKGYQALRDIGMSERVITGVRLLTKTKGTPYFDYLEALIQNSDSRKVKKSDLRHNMDIRRLKGVTEKDLRRIEKYAKAYTRIEDYEKMENV